MDTMLFLSNYDGFVTARYFYDTDNCIDFIKFDCSNLYYGYKYNIYELMSDCDKGHWGL
jgi:hypothetical protein